MKNGGLIRAQGNGFLKTALVRTAEWIPFEK